jgi:hypothetical protein
MTCLVNTLCKVKHVLLNRIAHRCWFMRSLKPKKKTVSRFYRRNDSTSKLNNFIFKYLKIKLSEQF